MRTYLMIQQEIEELQHRLVSLQMESVIARRRDAAKAREDIARIMAEHKLTPDDFYDADGNYRAYLRKKPATGQTASDGSSQSLVPQERVKRKYTKRNR